MKVIVIFIFFLFYSWDSLLAQSVSVGFYNVENLFDTIPSKFYDDEFTPEHRKAWDTERYQRKLTNIATVIDQMDCDVIGLCEVENEGVVRDLVLTLKGDYCYVHQTSSDHRGLDVALLYKGDVFIPTNTYQISSPYREPMVVDGLLEGREVTMIVCHMPSQLNRRSVLMRALDVLVEWRTKRYDTDRALILMGDFNFGTSDAEINNFCSNNARYDTLFRELSNPIGVKYCDLGTYLYEGKWSLLDNIFVDDRLMNGAVAKFKKCALYFSPEMFMTEKFGKHRLNSTFSRGMYLGGYSDHLPLFVTFELSTE